MLLAELFHADGEILIEGMVFARRGKKIVRRYRCTSGPRRGQTVKNAGSCGGSRDAKRRVISKRAYARKGRRILGKRRRTLRLNPISLRVQALNRRRK